MRARVKGMRPAAWGAALALAFSGTGCTTLRYLVQAGHGQLAMANRARPISEVLKDERVPPRIRKLLEEIPAVKAYGEARGVKPTSNYTEYTALDRPAAVWVVSACRPLKFEAKTWKFPVAGEFTTLGWFDLEAAKEHGEELRAEGWDVDVRGARAYSTLGWFRDAVVSSMIPEGGEALGELVNVVIHESVHATLYLDRQPTFNESLASFVADRLAPEYLKETRGPSAPELAAYLKAEADGRARRDALHAAYRELDALYSSDKPDAEKLETKKRVLESLRERLKFKREITNATLYQFRTYEAGPPELEKLFVACGSDWARFWAALMPLQEDDGRALFEGRGQVADLGPPLERLARERCGSVR